MNLEFHFTLSTLHIVVYQMFPSTLFSYNCVFKRHSYLPTKLQFVHLIAL